MQLLGWALALTAAYWVITLADQQKDFTKILGKVIAWLIIVVCVLGLLVNLGKHGKKNGQSSCAFSQGHPGGGPGAWKKHGGWGKWKNGGEGRSWKHDGDSKDGDGKDEDDEDGDDSGHYGGRD